MQIYTLRFTLMPILFFLSVFLCTIPSSAAELSQKEKDFLENHPVITLGSDARWSPYVIVNNQGLVTGFDTDILNLINEKTGANFQIVPGLWTEMVEKAKNKETYGLSTSSANKERSSYLNYSDTYYSIPKLLIVAAHNPKDIKSVRELNGMRVGYQADNIFDRSVITAYEGVQAVPVESFDSLVSELVKGNLDAAVAAQSIYTSVQGSTSIIKTADIFPNGYLDLVFAVRKEYPEAISILNKGLASISNEENLNIINKWFINITQAKSMELNLTEDEQAYLDSRDSISVASLDNFPPFNFRVDGIPGGYSIEYLKLMGDLLGKEIKVINGPWNSLLEKFRAGEVDILPHIAVTEERKKFIDYTDFTHISFYTGFGVRKGSSIASMKDLNNKKLAIVDKYFLHDYIIKDYPEIDLMVVDDSEAAIEAVSSGKAFAVIHNIPTINYFILSNWLSNIDIVTVSDFGQPDRINLFMGVAKGNTQLKSILEKANASLAQEDINRLKNKWFFSATNRTRTTLSTAEENFIEEHPVIRFRVNPNRPPFEFERDGRPVGITVDYITAIAEKAGFQAEFIISDMPIKEAYDVITGSRSAFDTLTFSVKSPEREERFAFGDTFLSYPMMIITNKETPVVLKLSDLQRKTVAVEKGYLTNQWLARDYPDIEIIPAETSTDALRMVNDGSVDAYVGNIGIANYMITNEGMDNLKVAAPSGYGNIEYSFIAPKEWPELASILSKAYRTLPQELHSSIQQKWFSVQIIEKINYRIIWEAVAVSLAIVVLLVWWNRSLRQAKAKSDKLNKELSNAQSLLMEQNEKLEKLSVTDALTNIFNRMKLDSILSSEFTRSERYGSVFGIVLADVDHFKNVNDTYGHQVGDEVLIKVASILKDNVRNVDIVGRWGGEEFLVICPNTDEKGTFALAENLRKIIETTVFGEAGHLTASFGISAIKKDDTMESLVAKADSALYDSKEGGRNRVSRR